MLETNHDKLFDAFNLAVSATDVEVGKTYPIYGRITRILSDTPGCVIAEINNNMLLTMPIPNENGVTLLRQRCFDWGIFVAHITGRDEMVHGTCETVIFGKPGITH
ncbi:MAG: hypothetical protein PHC51_04805 [bacterium]|nr:hypothetical protein [bacterium]